MTRAYRACGLGWVAGLLVGVATAATYSVPGDYATISSAVASAPDGSTILVAPGTYNEYISALDIGRSLYLKSTGGAGVTFISGGGANRLLRIDNASTSPEKSLTFDGFTFANGRGGGNLSPVSITRARPAFLNCVFQDNSSPEKGGAVLVYGTPTTHAIFVNCIFRRNVSDRYGGAVLVNNGQCRADFKDCLFEDNSSRTAASSVWNEGGAINYAVAGGSLQRCVFRRNSTIYAGGALMLINDFASPMVTVKVSGCTFEGNFALSWNNNTASSPPSEAGGIMVEDNVYCEVDGCVFSNNYAQSGGAIQVYRGRTRVSNSVFDNNRAIGTSYLGFGGAIAANSSDSGAEDQPNAVLWVERSMIRNCLAPVGGGLFVQGDVSRGTASGYRGEVYLNEVVIENCRSTTAGSSYGNGGGLFAALGHVAGTNVFLLNNRADYVGGGFAMVQNTFLYLRNSFVVGNTAAYDSAYHCPAAPYPSFSNTLISNNGGGSSGSASALAVIPPVSFGNRTYLAYVNVPYGTPSLAPRIGALANRGGYAAGTAVDTAMTSNTTYTLTSQFSPQSDAATWTPYGVRKLAYTLDTYPVPGTVEAEDFDVGGSGLAYRDITVANQGGSYRSEAVDVAADGSAGGGHYVGWLNAGEWMDYSVRVAVGGTYQLWARVAAAAGGGSFYVSINGAPGTTVVVNATGGATTWQEISAGAVTLSAGVHLVRLVAVTPGFSLDSLRVATQAPQLALSVSKLLRVVKVGSNAVSHSFQVRNAGGSNMSYSVSDNAAWLSVTPGSGSSSGESDTLQVSYNASGLATGTYTAVITVTAPDAANSPEEIAVTLRVRPNKYVMGDFDGDGASDLGVYYAPGGNWYVFRSSLGFLADQFGYNGTLPIPGDYDGDGRSDLACYYPPGGNWYMFRSSAGFRQDQFGYAGTVPVAGDFDGDGESDLACYYPPGGNWYVFGSTEGFQSAQFGYAGTIPVPGDYDGDGRWDMAIYHPTSGTWYIRGSTSGLRIDQHGFAGTVPVSGDFDGDGRHDQAVYHAATGMWYLKTTTDGQYTRQFGYAGTMAVSGDYDGDGKGDLVVYYPPGGNWYVWGSSAGIYFDQFGFAGTLPLGGVF